MLKFLATAGATILSGISYLLVMTATDITNIIIALSSLAGAVLAGVAAIYAARAKLSAQQAKDDIAIVKVETNHMKDELVKVTRLEALQAGRQEGQQAAKEVAEAVAEAVSVVEARRPAPVEANPKATENLEKIEEHTEATAENTARTEAKVKEAIKKKP